jgi:hypothetical protein
VRKSRAFLLYVEPTPYVEGLIKEIRRVWSGDLDVCYIAEDQSQDWKIDAKFSGGTILMSRQSCDISRQRTTRRETL